MFRMDLLPPSSGFNQPKKGDISVSERYRYYSLDIVCKFEFEHMFSRSEFRLLQWLVSVSSMWPHILMIVDIQESAHLHIAEINTDFVDIW